MRYLHKLFHEQSSKDFNEVYERRYNFESTIHTSLIIKPINQSKNFELYYTPTNRMLVLISEIYAVAHQLQTLFTKLPSVARDQFVNECLVEELFNTNELEGIRSSREEIARSTKELQLNKKLKRRFSSMIFSYLKLLNNEISTPLSTVHIRKIYDEITRGEIEADELPDGEIFRKEETFVLKKSGSEKVVHRGITPESKIIESIEKLLYFMNNNNDIPNIIKIAIGHYYFGYIHPFYDGNGRTSRFISSTYLSKELGIVSAISISRGSNKFKNKYLDAFEITNSIKSRGELNVFIDTFLEIISKTLKQMSNELKEKSELLTAAIHKLDQEEKLSNSDKLNYEIMFILAQNLLFDINSGLTIKELAKHTEKSEATIRKSIKELVNLDLVKKQGERPVYCTIKDDYLES